MSDRTQPMIRKKVYQICRKSSTRRAVRRHAHVFETLLLAAAVSMGNSAYAGTVHAEAAETEISETTPEFSWDNYTAIAHALGGVDGTTYLNSRESFLESYQKGIRLFEVDLVRTSDEIWVCRHTWKQSMGQWEEEGKKILSAQEFLNTPLEGKYTPLSLEDLLELLQEYPDAFALLDTKQYAVRSYQMTLQDYAEFVETARKTGTEDALDQLIPEIYNQGMFAGAAMVHRFPSYIYSFWEELSEEELITAADFCKEKGILAAAFSKDFWTEEIQNIFDERGIRVYIYTVNDAEEAAGFMEGGAAGMCSDFLSEEDLLWALQAEKQ